MASADMNPILGNDGNTSVRGPRERRAAITAAGLICFILAAFFYVVVRLQPVLERRPQAFVILPVLGVLCMLSILPLAFFLGSQSQFGRLNPLNPRDYILLARKSLRALRENGDLKVRSKDF